MATNNNSHDDTLHTPLLSKTSSQTHSLFHSISLLFQDWFLWELLSVLSAIVALIPIIAILAAYDARSLPDWPSVITINSVISFFSAISKLSTTAAVGACISQSKWLWYKRHPRPLQDVQLFDGASRGPWGAVSFLFAIKTKSQASIGAAIVVLMLLFDPFLQQVVNYPDRLVASDTPATIVRAQRYGAHSFEGLPLPSVLDLSMKAAIYGGIFDVDGKGGGGPEHYCSSGNCTWDNFSSLAVCSKCADITSYIDKACNETGCYSLSLPGGPSITGFGGQINSSVSNISTELNRLPPTIVQFSSLISKSEKNSEDASAHECVLSYCVNVYSAVVRDGNLKETVTRSWLNRSASLDQDSDLLYYPPASITNTTGNYSEFRVANLAARAMNSFMSETFTGSGGINSSRSGSAFSSDVIQALYTAQNYSSTIENLAQAMAQNIRRQNDSGLGPLSGIAYQSETYVHVRWAWLAYPGIIIVLAILLLAGVIIENAQGQLRVWGASNIALLFHGQGLSLEDENHSPINTISQMTTKAKAVEVHLIKASNKEWKLIEAG